MKATAAYVRSWVPARAIAFCLALASAAGAAEPDKTGQARLAPAFESPRDAAIAGALTRLGQAPHIAPLKLPDRAFLTLVTPPRAPLRPGGAVLLVPAEAAAISDPLMQSLARIPPGGGWLTMAMQPPPGGQPAREAFCARLSASLAHLQAQAGLPIVLAAVGGSLDASLACHAQQLPAGILAVAGIGRWHGELDALALPVLDLVPAADPTAQRAARTRAVSAEQRAPGTYLQVAVDAMDERFTGGEEEVAKRLRGWLAQLPRTSSR